MTYTINICPDAAAFLTLAEPFLLREEAAHNLILGIAGVVRDDPARYSGTPYFAVVKNAAGEVVGAMMRTLPCNLLLSRAPENAVSAMAVAVRAEYNALPGLVAPTEIAASFAGEWQVLSGQPHHRAHAERIYALSHVTPPSPVTGGARRCVETDRDLLIAWNRAFAADAGLRDDPGADAQGVDARLRATPETGGLWLWEVDGKRVSLAGYSGPTAHGIRISPVYTPLEHRGHGYASANVAALSQWLLRRGRQFCFLFTDLANPTANKIYAQIGYRPVCDVDEYAFLAPLCA